MAATPAPVCAPALQLGHRLRILLGGSYGPLAAVLGASTRTLTRVETWSGPSAAALLLLTEAEARAVPTLARTLVDAHLDAVVASRPSARKLKEARSDAAKALDVLTDEFGRAPAGQTLRELLEEPLDWVYWATSARADAEETCRLAREDGVVCRPLLENEKNEVHGYLFAIRPGDRVLLAHDRRPLAWLEVVEGDAPPPNLHSERREGLGKDDPNRLVPLLPHVFRFVSARSPLGARLAGGLHPYRLFDGRLPGDGTESAGRRTEWFSALAVREMHSEVPAELELEGRDGGYRSRMTRYRGEG